MSWKDAKTLCWVLSWVIVSVLSVATLTIRYKKKVKVNICETCFFNHPIHLMDCLCSSSLPSPSCSFLMESRWLTPTDQCNPWMDGRCITLVAMLLWLTLWFSSFQCWCPVHSPSNVSDKRINTAAHWWLSKTWWTLHLKLKHSSVTLLHALCYLIYRYTNLYFVTNIFSIRSMLYVKYRNWI